MKHRKGLYPEIEPFNSGHLRVSDLHQVYYEQCGNPNGKPVVFLHGGPGGGGDTKPRRFFNPKLYRIVLFDQRGCGRSQPHASLEENTTWHLVDDIEKIRQHLGIKRWQVFGGSWGSTLALVYAQAHPKRVSELIVRGIFLASQKELRWFYQEGANQLFPDLWEQFLEPIPVSESLDLISAYHRRLTGDDKQVALEAAKAWSIWEGATCTLLQEQNYIDKFGESEFALAIARIEAHYFVNNAFLNDDQILKDIGKIRRIPAVIVHGRYDVICPVVNAWQLHQAWPEADLRIVPAAGHLAFEPGIVHELVEATERFGASSR